MGKRLVTAVQVRSTIKELDVESGVITGTKVDAWEARFE